MRVRIANQPLTASDWAGMAVTGEVEDYMVYVGDFDFGDAADSGAGANSTSNYHTTLADSGHIMVYQTLYLWVIVRQIPKLIVITQPARLKPMVMI